MSFWQKIQRRRDEDAAYVDEINSVPDTVGAVRVNDPIATRIGRTYTPADIEALEAERVPWLRKRRRR